LNIVEEFGGRSGSVVGFGGGVELWRYGDIEMDLGSRGEGRCYCLGSDT